MSSQPPRSSGASRRVVPNDALLSGVGPIDALLSAFGPPKQASEDDARWLRDVIAAVGRSDAPSAASDDLDRLLDAPFPEEHPHDDDADLAAEAAPKDESSTTDDLGTVERWETDMTEDPLPPPTSSPFAALAGLTRTNPPSRPAEGAAQGDDSGLIDLRAMSEPEVRPSTEVAVASARSESGASGNAGSNGNGGTTAANGSNGNKAAVAQAAAVERIDTLPPPVARGAAPSLAGEGGAQTGSGERKGAGLWLVLGGLAAAAAVAAVVIPLAKKNDAQSEAPAVTAPAAPAAQDPAAQAAQAEEKKTGEAPLAAAEPNPAPAPPVAEGKPAEPESAAGGAPIAAKGIAGAPAGAAGGAPAGAPVAAKGKVEPEKVEAPKAAEADPIKKPAGGSLDDVLGINKPAEAAAPKEAVADLPDRPDSMDVRSAINGKLGVAGACVKGLDGPSSVSVTFGPSGAVSAVAVTSGAAKGSGAEGCIKSAFGTAKVPASKKGASGAATLTP
jgi:hypothetical protein